MSETDKEAKWPREIWLAELDEHHNGTGMVVLSEFATVPRWEGDDERDCDFQRYVDGDIYDSADKYWRERTNALQARVAELEGALEPFSNAAGAFFAKNGEKGDIIYDGGSMRSDCIFGEDLFTARQALKENQDG